MSKGSGGTRATNSGSSSGNPSPLKTSNQSISSSTPEKIQNLINLASKMGISDSVRIDSRGMGSDYKTNNKTSWGDPVYANITDAAQMTIKAPEASNFNYGARMFVKPTDEGNYHISHVDVSQVKNKQGYYGFKTGYYSPKETVKMINKFKNHFGM